MTQNRLSRFLIDSIDRRLGSKEKEIKFDKVAIAFSLLLIIACAINFLWVKSLPAWLIVLLIFFMMFGIVFLVTMVKELLRDSKDRNSNNN